MNKTFLSFLVIIFSGFSSLLAQDVRIYSFEELADLTVQNSFMMRDTELELKRRNYGYISALARLRSRVDLALTTPEFRQNTSEQYNSDTQLYDFFTTKTLKNELGLSITKPFWTNGKLSVNSNMDRFTQSGTADYTSRLFLKLDQPVFTSNSLRRNIRETELELDDAKINYVRQRISLVYGNGIVRDHGGRFFGNTNTLSHHYYSLLDADQQLKIDTKNQAIWNILSQLAKTKFEEEKISEREFLLFDIEFTNSRDRVFSSQSRRDKAVRALAQFTGLDPNTNLAIKDDISYTPIAIDEERAIAEGLKNNTGIREMEIRIVEDSLRIDEVRSWSEFKGTLTGTFGLNRTAGDFKSQFEDFNRAQSFKLNLSMPVWDWGRNSMRVQAAEVSLKQTKNELENDKTDTRRQVRAHVNTIDNMRQRIELINKAKKLSQKAYAMAKRYFEEDKTSSEDLIQAVNKYYESESEYLKLIVDYKNSLIRLANQTQWDFEKGVRIRDQIEQKIDVILDANNN